MNVESTHLFFSFLFREAEYLGSLPSYPSFITDLTDLGIHTVSTSVSQRGLPERMC